MRAYKSSEGTQPWRAHSEESPPRDPISGPRAPLGSFLGPLGSNLGPRGPLGPFLGPLGPYWAHGASCKLLSLGPTGPVANCCPTPSTPTPPDTGSPFGSSPTAAKLEKAFSSLAAVGDEPNGEPVSGGVGVEGVGQQFATGPVGPKDKSLQLAPWAQ